METTFNFGASVMKIAQEKMDYFLFLVGFFITATANTITVSNITVVVSALFTLYIFWERGYEFDKAFLYFLAAYIGLWVIYIIKFGYLDLRSIRELFRVLHGYLLIRLLWKKFIPYFTKTTYVLALISLPLYLLQLYDYDMMRSIIGVIDHNIPALDYRGDWYENIFIFTLNDNGIYRNSGFAWEPKGFGTFLTLAMFFRLIENRFRLLDKYMITYIIAMITTFSTATFSVFFFAVVPFYIFNKPSAYKIISASLLIPIIAVVFFKADFLQKKIIHEYETRNKYVAFVQDDRTDMESRSLGRFGSFLIDWMDLKKQPIFGYGEQKFERTEYSVSGVHLIHVNGFSDFMAKYGIVGMIFLFTTLFLTFKQWSIIYEFRGWYFIPIGILLTSFASAILFYPIYQMLYFFPFFKKGKEAQKIEFDVENRALRWN